MKVGEQSILVVAPRNLTYRKLVQQHTDFRGLKLEMEGTGLAFPESVPSTKERKLIAHDLPAKKHAIVYFGPRENSGDFLTQTHSFFQKNKARPFMVLHP